MPQPTGCLASILALFVPKPPAPADLPYARRDWLLTKAETRFFTVLRQAVGQDYTIFPKIRLADLLLVKGAKDNTARTRALNKITSKHADFTLCDPATLKPLLVIELDDSSHATEKVQKRDAFVDAALAAAGLPVLHVKATRAYNTAQLARDIQIKLHPPAETR